MPTKRLIFWTGLAVLCLAFWVAVVFSQGKWLSPRAWGAFVLGLLVPYWAITGKIDVTSDDAESR